MDKKWIDDLSEIFHNKISDIYNIWVEIGIPNEKYASRVQNIQWHVNDLLEDMLKEERRHKQEVVDSIKSLTKTVIELSTSLEVDSNLNLNSNESILAQESFLLDKQNELKLIKETRLNKWQSLLAIEDKLCSRLYEYKENFNAKSVPTVQLLNAFETKINELEKLQAYRKQDFVTKRELIVELCHELYNCCPDDAMIESIYNDNDVSNVPLSNDFLNQCDNIINRLSTDLRSNIAECGKLKERYKKLHEILFPSVDLNSLIFFHKNCEDYSYKALIKLKEGVSQLENCRLEKLGEFIAKYRNNIREKLRNNFSSHLESSEKYRDMLDSQEQSESLCEQLEKELANWTAIDTELHSLRQEMESWERLVKRLAEINLNLKDPIILKNRGGILLKVEKEKKSVKKELPKIEARIRKVLTTIDEKHSVDTSDLRFKDLPILEYISGMGERIDGEKENDKKDRSLTAANCSTSSLKKPLKSSQNNLSSSANKPTKSQFKKPDFQNIPSKMLKKKKPLSPIAKAQTNLDHRFSKSFSSLEIKKPSHQLSGSNVNLYAMFCEDVNGGAMTSSFVVNKFKRK